MLDRDVLRAARLAGYGTVSTQLSLLSDHRLGEVGSAPSAPGLQLHHGPLHDGWRQLYENTAESTGRRGCSRAGGGAAGPGTAPVSCRV
ncbi:hypothetical protein SFIMM107S_03387 [Streptomyces griseus]